MMRVLVETLDDTIVGEVIGGDLLDGTGGGFDLQSIFTVRCDDGQCFSVHGWMSTSKCFKTRQIG